ncbi:MAG TPA: DNA-binding domain-containing protein, partial [Marinagarivorans sp.]|nr:DNA-binding domain-containing protein [Marinagarivorans sp.]
MDKANLAGLQQWFLNALRDPSALDAMSVTNNLLPAANINASACLAIYQRSYVLRLRQCLGDQFPATRHALGEHLFNDFVDCYLKDCPSTSYTLYDLGKRFSEWLEHSRPDRALPEEQRESWIDFMVDLSAYESALFRLFDAPGHEGGEWPQATVADDNLILQPYLTLATYRYPVAWYYHEIRAGRCPSFPPQATSQVVMLRRDYQTATFPVTAVQFRFLEKMRDGVPISQVLDDIASWTKQPLAQVIHSWRTEVRRPWIAAGFFIECTLLTRRQT